MADVAARKVYTVHVIFCACVCKKVPKSFVVCQKLRTFAAIINPKHRAT